MTREDVVQELQRVAKLLGKDSFSRSEFQRHGSFSSSNVERSFGSWRLAMEVAGLTPITTNVRKTDEELQDEFLRVKTLLGKTPTINEFAAHSKIDRNVYAKRFGNWTASVVHYMGEEGGPITKHTKIDVEAPSRTDASPQGRFRTSDRLRRGPTFGPSIDFRGLRHEPLDEQGVVFLFGMVARELGFLVERVKDSFPDCLAKQAVKRSSGKMLYQEVSIEFEFKSSNFRAHGHPADGCDLVVCWEHYWPDCPVDVLELRSAIRQLKSDE